MSALPKLARRPRRFYLCQIMADADQTIHIIGGGLAGSEAAWQAARAGAHVILHEMRPELGTEVHLTGELAELVCSNSFRSDDYTANAVGLLHEEMRRCASLIMRCADANRVPAGGALAVDRTGFSNSVEAAIEAEPSITIRRGEVTHVPVEGAAVTIVATGPLTSTALATAIQTLTGEEALAFFDAIAPIVYRDTINFDKAWRQSRYDKGSGRDYINCPLNGAQYAAFVEALIAADTVSFHEWEATTPYFEGCLPIEVMAARGPETLAFGPMKPVGLTNLHAPDQKPKAVVQLRQDNALGTLYNMVGFQTKLRHREQIRVLRMIPGLETADFARLGGLHRNTFINGPRLLGPRLHLKSAPQLMFAGQITGCEGYVESAAVGLLAGRFAASDIFGPSLAPPPPVTALGSLLAHITGGGDEASYQPMNVNFGLFPPMEQPDLSAGQKKLNVDKRLRSKARKSALSARALKAIDKWLTDNARETGFSPNIPN